MDSLMPHAMSVPTPSLSAFSIEFSPFNANIAAVVGGSNFGIKGSGVAAILQHSTLSYSPILTSNDVFFDCTWNEKRENQLALACGDGSVLLIDTLNSRILRKWRENSKEVHSIDWNLHSKDTFVTASWDSSIKLWSPNHERSIRTYSSHNGKVFCTIWHPSSNFFVSCGSDRTFKIWDMTSPNPNASIQGHLHDVLSADFDKYQPSLLTTTSADKTIKTWDIRKLSCPLHILVEPKYGSRRIKYSPFMPSLFATVGYGMNCSVWCNHELAFTKKYSEFTTGLDFSLANKEILAVCGWNQSVDFVNISSTINNRLT